MLINGSSRGGSVVLELIFGALLIASVGLGVYQLQHPHLTQQQQITAAIAQ